MNRKKKNKRLHHKVWIRDRERNRHKKKNPTQKWANVGLCSPLIQFVHWNQFTLSLTSSIERQIYCWWNEMTEKQKIYMTKINNLSRSWVILNYSSEKSSIFTQLHMSMWTISKMLCHFCSSNCYFFFFISFQSYRKRLFIQLNGNNVYQCKNKNTSSVCISFGGNLLWNNLSSHVIELSHKIW